MTTPMFLDRRELQELTARSRRDAQRAMLNAMGIEHRVRPDGSLAVLRAHVERIFGAQQGASRKTKPVEPNWDAM